MNSSRAAELVQSRSEILVRQARRYRKKGETRRAMICLREACHREGESARLWALYAMACLRAGKRKDGITALTQALWLRKRERDSARAGVIQQLLEQARAGYSADSIRAA